MISSLNTDANLEIKMELSIYFQKNIKKNYNF